MAAINGYVTEADVGAYLSINDSADDALIADAITSMSRVIDDRCRRRFYLDAAASTRSYRAPGRSGVVHVDDIGSLTGLAIATDTSGDGTFGTTWTTTDYELEPLNGVVNGSSGWPYTSLRAVGSYGFYDQHGFAWRRSYIQVTARWGWPAVPEPVRQACLVLASGALARKDASFGVAGFTEFGAVRVREDPSIATWLEPYRLQSIY